MKKLLVPFLMVAMLFVFTGCISDEEYIDTVKGITFENGDTVEDVVNYNLMSYDLVVWNADIIPKISKNWVGYTVITLNDNEYTVMEDHYRTIGKAATDLYFSVMTEIPEYTWEVEGKTSTGKVISVSSQYASMKITTTDDGDYIRLNMNDIKLKQYDGYNVTDEQKSVFMQVNNLCIKYLDEYGQYDDEFWEALESHREEFSVYMVDYISSYLKKAQDAARKYDRVTYDKLRINKEQAFSDAKDAFWAKQGEALSDFWLQEKAKDQTARFFTRTYFDADYDKYMY